MNNVRYNRRRAKRRMRRLAEECERKRDINECETAECVAPSTPPDARSKGSESEASTPASQPSHANEPATTEREVVKRRA
eukprot:4106924-Pleurochrysis_carterae.AAC.1